MSLSLSPLCANFCNELNSIFFLDLQGTELIYQKQVSTCFIYSRMVNVEKSVFYLVLIGFGSHTHQGQMHKGQGESCFIEVCTVHCLHICSQLNAFDVLLVPGLRQAQPDQRSGPLLIIYGKESFAIKNYKQPCLRHHFS